MSAEHTTTPWAAVLETRNWAGQPQRPFLAGIVGPDGKAVVLSAFTLSSGRYPGEDEPAANSMFVVRAVNAHEALVEALTEMVTAHSMKNVGVDASRRRIAAVTKARALLKTVQP